MGTLLLRILNVIAIPFLWILGKIRRSINWLGQQVLHVNTSTGRLSRMIEDYFRNLESRHLAFNRFHFLLIGCFVFTYFWLRRPLMKFYDDIIISNTFNKLSVDPLGGLLGTFYLILAVIIAYIIIIKYRPARFMPTAFMIAAMLFVSVIYVCERLKTGHYIFQKIYGGQHIFAKIALLDPILLFAFGLGTAYIIAEFFSDRQPSSVLSFINPDHAIINKSDDEFERTDFVEKIAKWLNGLRLPTDNSFVIGINGSWGFGKSSLLQMIAGDIREDIIKVQFNPWIANKDYNLIKDFFNTLDNALSQRIATSNIFQKYGRKLTKVDDDKNPLKAFKDMFEDEPLQKSFKKLTDLVKKIRKPVYVFIDDIDRLNKEEVYEILRLIRSSASFSNLIFIIAYDRRYIEEALKATLIPESEKYLEKIIQLEIKVPAISVELLKNAFANELKKQIEATALSTMQKQQAIQMTEGMVIGNSLAGRNKKYGFNNNIPYFFHNKRDIVRFTNALVLKLSFYFDQVYVPDLFLVELITLFLPQLHSRITSQTDNYVHTTKQGTNLQILALELDKTDTFMLLQGEPQLTEYIEKVYEHDAKLKVIESLIEALISEPLPTDPNHDHGIYYRDYYDSYFTLVIPANVINLATLQSLVTTTTTIP
jgi:KAP family P-loop domain